MSVSFSEIKVTHKLGEVMLNGRTEYRWNVVYLGERCKLPQWGLGQIEFGAF